MIELKGIYKSYGEGELTVPVLKNINLNIEEGDYLAIMGPSGSGKSTLMNILGALDKADEGTYILDGQNISNLNENQLSEARLHKIGFVFQTFQLLPQETALENVALPLGYAGFNKQERIQRSTESLKRVGLGERCNFLPSQLSGGQKQRVAIARALINNPRIILADEPTGALDQASGAQVMKLFEELHKEGVTIVMITHDAKVAAHAKKVVHIIDGELFHKPNELENQSEGVF